MKSMRLMLGAVLAVCSAGIASAADRREAEEMRKEQMAQTMDQWPDKPSLGQLMEKFKAPIDLVAKIHPMPAAAYKGTTLKETGINAIQAVGRVGDLVEHARREPHLDAPNKYVADAADEAISELAKGFNEFLVPSGEMINDATRKVSDAAAALYVVASLNNQKKANPCAAERAIAQAAGEHPPLPGELPNPQTDSALKNPPYPDPGQIPIPYRTLFGAKALADMLRASGVDASAGCGDSGAAAAPPPPGPGARNQYNSGIAQTGYGVVAQAKFEEPTVRQALVYMTMGGESSRKAMEHMRGIFPVLDKAEQKAKAMAAHHAAYSKGMKDKMGAGAQKSEQALRVAINAVAQYAGMINEVGGRLNELIMGPMKTAYDKVYDCTLQNITTGRLLQTAAGDGAKAASVTLAQYKNYVAVTSVQKVTEPYNMVVTMIGGALELPRLPEKGVAGAAPKAGMSPEVRDNGAVGHLKRDSGKLVCVSGKQSC